MLGTIFGTSAFMGLAGMAYGKNPDAGFVVILLSVAVYVMAMVMRIRENKT